MDAALFTHFMYMQLRTQIRQHQAGGDLQAAKFVPLLSQGPGGEPAYAHSQTQSPERQQNASSPEGLTSTSQTQRASESGEGFGNTVQPLVRVAPTCASYKPAKTSRHEAC